MTRHFPHLTCKHSKQHWQITLRQSARFCSDAPTPCSTAARMFLPQKCDKPLTCQAHLAPNDTLRSAASSSSGISHLACLSELDQFPFHASWFGHRIAFTSEARRSRDARVGCLRCIDACCSCLLLLLRAVPLDLDPSEVTYSRRAPTENLPFCPAYSSSFTGP